MELESETVLGFSGLGEVRSITPPTLPAPLAQDHILKATVQTYAPLFPLDLDLDLDLDPDLLGAITLTRVTPNRTLRGGLGCKWGAN